MLSTLQIKSALSKHPLTRAVFQDVCPADRLPRTLTRGKAYVINTHPSHLPGEHWIALYRETSGTVKYFDSLGLGPLINLRGYTVICWDRRIQGLLPFCGHYVIAFILSLSNPQVLKQFDGHVHSNDLRVKLLVQREFGV